MKITSLLYADRSFSDLLNCLSEMRSAEKPLPVLVNGLSGGALDALYAETALALAQKRVTTVFFAPDDGSAVSLLRLLTDAGVRAAYYPARELTFLEYSASHATERERLFALLSLARGEIDAVVTTPAAAVGYTIPKQRLLTASLSFSVGDTLDMEEFAGKLTALGYARTDLVESAGQFARRGGIIDLWSREDEKPLRVEFFGDEVDRMCEFDPLTQRVIGPREHFSLLPAHEVLVGDAERAAIRKKILSLQGGAVKEGQDELKQELAALDGGIELASRDRFLSLIYPEKETLLDYLAPRSVIVFLGTNETNENLASLRAQRKETREALLAAGIADDRDAWEDDEKTCSRKLSRHVPLHVNPFGTGSFQKEGGLFGFRCRRLPTYRDAPKALTDDLAAFLSGGASAVIVTESAGEAASTASYLSDLGFTAVTHLGDDLTPADLTPGVALVISGSVSSGYELISARVAVLSLLGAGEEENRRRLRTRKQTKYAPGETILSYLELKPGDLVVHERYGIGRFVGMESLAQDGVLRDYIRIRYAGTDALFIPADRLDAVTKYIGAKDGGAGVRLSRMGGSSWNTAKSRAKGAARDMAKELIALYAARQRQPGIAFSPIPDMEEEFNGNFDFDLTEPQETAVRDILGDMTRAVPMDRLLCGDVGYGKTEVAFRAAFRAIANGYQVALLVPTTILALQHYETAVARFRGFAVQADMISRFRTAKESAAIRRRLARGETDLIIGTHSLLAGNITYKNLGLLIVDEEQRFGVAQKEKIKAIAKNVDVLTLTATPIPRTLNMAISGIRDLSVLDEAPGDRRPVETYVLEYREDVLFSAIRKELARAGQVLYLHNRTEEIDLVAGRIQNAFPGARVAFAHGQMEHDEIEGIWEELVRGEIDILVCTTIIETGVDLPNANTLIIENADRLGLAQLHQIRGRIGRSSRQAYAYFTYRIGKTLSEEAYKRLSAIREYAEFGAGFRIALRDLEIRGAGDLLGASQHGHIEGVGYDLYVRLLEEAVLEEQGKPKEKKTDCTVDLHLDAHIPESYIATSAHRMEMYKKISLITSPEDLSDVMDELCDRFGEPPRPTERLLYISLTRYRAEKARLLNVVRRDKELLLYPEKPELDVWAELIPALDGVRPPNARNPAFTVLLPEKHDPARAAADILGKYLTAYRAVHEKEVPQNGSKTESTD